ncbi:hypothetical protein EV426DRAFT_280214 [Tirmania nivea]|nr:hypothetical protein EV426DRAFT_280214 [Tirmania nivea]
MRPPPSPDLIASTILNAFHSLPARSKPRIRPDGSREWTTLAGIALEHEDGHLTCASLATGVKCLPTSKIPLAQGLVLHDSHAEILAIRAFNHFLLHEAHLTLHPPSSQATYHSPYLSLRPHTSLTPTAPQPFTLNPTLRTHLYTTEAPCGDCSMELTISSQADPIPWVSPESSPPKTIRGRGYFSHLGHVRTKPSRPDAPPTGAKSCSDKLSSKMYTSLLCTPTSYLVTPALPGAYLDTMTVPGSEFSEVGCERAFSPRGRLEPLNSTTNAPDMQGGYSFRPFNVQTTSSTFLPFVFSRRAEPDAPAPTPSNISTIYIPHSTQSIHEILISAVLQGRKAFSPISTPALALLGASCVSKMRLWGDTVVIAEELLRSHPHPVVHSLVSFLVGSTKGEYEYLKSPEPEDLVGEGEGVAGIAPGQTIRLARWTAKEVVRGVLARAGGGGGVWVRNGGNGFGLVRGGEGGVKVKGERKGKR